MPTSAHTSRFADIQTQTLTFLIGDENQILTHIPLGAIPLNDDGMYPNLASCGVVRLIVVLHVLKICHGIRQSSAETKNKYNTYTRVIYVILIRS